MEGNISMAEIQDGSATFVVRDKRQQALIDLIHPVGTIYMSEDASFNPNTTWGVGTWVKTAINRVLQGTNDTNKVGSTKEAGLPNFEAAFNAKDNVGRNELGCFGSPSGGCVIQDVTHPAVIVGANDVITSSFTDRVYINAHYYNPIYGTSDTVQPPAELVFIWKRIA